MLGIREDAADREPASNNRQNSPDADRLLQRESLRHPELVTILSAFEESEELADAFRTPPVYVPCYQVEPEEIGVQAEFSYRTRRHLTVDALREFRRELGIIDWNAPLHTRLIFAGLKWRPFQAGEFDVALVMLSVFARNCVRAENMRPWILQTTALLRQIGLDARNLLAGLKERPDGADP